MLDDDFEGEGSEEESPAAERESIYNVDVLHEKLEDFGWSEQERWVETQVVTSAEPVSVSNVEDDLERELAFYNQAMEGTKAAIARFEGEGLAWARPADYLAEMVKSDEHMARVKEQLLHQTKLVQEMEQRRRDRESKRFSKQVQTEKRRERDMAKKKAITDVSRLRKQRERSGYQGELDLDAELGGAGGRPGRGPPKNPGDRFQAHDKSKKRQRKDAKFGFGGKKRLQKQNDAYSSANVDDYSAPRKGGRGGGRGGGVRKGAAQNRPGKIGRASGRDRVSQGV